MNKFGDQLGRAIIVMLGMEHHARARDPHPANRAEYEAMRRVAAALAELWDTRPVWAATNHPLERVTVIQELHRIAFNRAA